MEVDFWELSRLQCYDKLSNWEELDQIVCDAVDGSASNDLLKVWDDTYTQVW